jgi:hypothetical protein
MIVNIHRNAGAMVLGLLPLLVGCAQPGSDELDEKLGVALGAWDGNNQTSNGLPAPDYHAHVAELRRAMDYALMTDNDLNEKLLDSQILATAEGTNVLKYAFQCAAFAGETLPKMTDPDFVGQNILETATEWRAVEGLDPSEQRDVLTCVVAHVNSTSGVQLVLAGPNVHDDGGGPYNNYDVNEAVWQVKVHTAGNIEYHVWNLIPGTECDQADAWQSLRERICAQQPDKACGFTRRNDFGGACVPQLNGFVCDGQPAIKTQLRRADLPTLHPRCRPQRPNLSTLDPQDR